MYNPNNIIFTIKPNNESKNQKKTSADKHALAYQRLQCICARSY